MDSENIATVANQGHYTKGLNAAFLADSPKIRNLLLSSINQAT